MGDEFELIVIGAGPAGGEAALAADHCGLRTALIDEGPAPGGQVWRAPRTEVARRSADVDFDRARGDDLRQRLIASRVTLLAQTQVWDVGKGFSVSCLSRSGARVLSAPRLVVATGAIERVRPFEGWTLPGVFGLAGATALMKSEKAFPGRDIVVAGQGPLLIAVAAKAVALGLRPRAVVDLNRAADWSRALPGLAAAPSLLWTGVRWMARLAAARVPIHRGAEVIGATGKETLELVIVRDLATGRRREIAADTLYIGNGLVPGDEILRLLGARQEGDTLRGGWRTICDADQRSTVPGLYVAGDGAGIHGALPSAAQGRIAGLAAAHDHGVLDAAGLTARSREARRRLKRLMLFANASCRLMQFPEDALDRMSASTTICRCEDVTLGDLLGAIVDGARDVNQLKHFTRLGMGPCQGRLCEMNAAALLQRKAQAPLQDSRLTPRAPVRPIQMGQLIGDFDYADIPVPKPAPL